MAGRWARLGCVAAAVTTSCASQHPHAPTPLTAEEVVGRMVAVYATAKTYTDRGDVTTEYSGPQARTTRAPFETAFARPDRFRFEFRNGYDPSPFVIWMRDGKIRSYHLQDAIEDEANLDSAAFRSRVPKLLLPSLASGQAIATLREPRLEGVETVDGHPCWRVHGSWLRGGEVTVWIDQTSYLLRRTTEHRHFSPAIEVDAFDVLETTSYEPTLNEAVLESSLSGPDPARIPRPRQDPWIGVQLEGTRIVRVIAGSPADHAGVHAADEIVLAGGSAISGVSDLVQLLETTPVGGPVSLVVRRGGRELTISVEVGDRIAFAKQQHELVGKPAPSFTASIVVGTPPLNAPNARDRLLVLDFTPTSFTPCADCKTSVTFFSKLQDKYGPRGLRVIGVSSDDAATLREFGADHQLHYSLAHDDGNQLADAYRVLTPSTVVIIDKAGIVRVIMGRSGLEVVVQHLLDEH